jgi:O-antigen/teichoic acid export membrane protein
MRPPERHGDGVSGIATLAIAGQLLASGVTAFLASKLTLGGFETYVVAVSVFLLVVRVAPRGVDKLALRVLPPMLGSGDWSGIDGYLRFAAGRIAASIAVLGMIGLAWTAWLDGAAGFGTAGIIAGIATVLASVLSQLCLEILTAAGRAHAATALVRLGVPALTLAGLAVWLWLGQPLTATAAIAGWSLGWTIAAAIMVSIGWTIFRPATRVAPRIEAEVWRRRSLPLWYYGIAVGLFAQSAILALELLGSAPVEVGAYAAATAVVGLALVLATATNRVYARQIAILIERGDADGLHALDRRRRWRLLPWIVLILAVAFALPGPVLALFRADFVPSGLWALRILAIAAAVSMAFATTPTILKYRDRHWAIFLCVASASALQLVLLLVFIPSLGATGAALAYAFSTVLMYFCFHVLAGREIDRISEADPKPVE